MDKYHNFIGIDIGKFNFLVAMHANNKTEEFENSPSGIRKFFTKYKTYLPYSLCCLETTGGYEAKLLEKLVIKKIPNSSC